MLRWFECASYHNCLDIFWPNLLKLPYIVGFCEGQLAHTLRDISASIKCHKSRHRVFQQVLWIRRQSPQNSQDQSCESRSVFTLTVWLSTITTTEDVWTRWLPWQQGLGRDSCVDGVHRKTEGPTGSVCGTELFFSATAATSAAVAFIRKDQHNCYC